MKNILIIKSVFCPNEHYKNVTLESLAKLQQFYKNLEEYYKLNYYFIGWTIYNDIINININSNIVTDFWNVNYGKYKIWNSIIEYSKLNTYDLIIYMDHDIYFDMGYFFNLKTLIDNYNDYDKFGLIAFNHKGDIRHQSTIYDNIEIINNNKFLWTKDETAIATGAIIIDFNIIKNLDYLSSNRLYGLDDYELCKKIKLLGYINTVIQNIYVYHPLDNYKNVSNYINWKKKCIVDVIKNNKINYDDLIKESNKIFNE